MALEAGNAIYPHFLKVHREYRDRLEQDLSRTGRETYPDPAAVKRLDLDLAKAALEKTSREISAAQDRITDIQARITRCDNRIGELTSDQARLEEALKPTRQWLAQYGEWKSWQQQAAQNRKTLKTIDLKIKTLEFQDGDLAPQDINSLYFQTQANLQQRSTELGVAALEREVQDLGRDLADLQGQMTRFQSTHAFDFDQARE
nr:hypothetical protein [uncultured Desulfobacter sp.]